MVIYTTWRWAEKFTFDCTMLCLLLCGEILQIGSLQWKGLQSSIRHSSCLAWFYDSQYSGTIDLTHGIFSTTLSVQSHALIMACTVVTNSPRLVDSSCSIWSHVRSPNTSRQISSRAIMECLELYTGSQKHCLKFLKYSVLSSYFGENFKLNWKVIFEKQQGTVEEEEVLVVRSLQV